MINSLMYEKKTSINSGFGGRGLWNEVTSVASEKQDYLIKVSEITNALETIKFLPSPSLPQS